MIDAILNKKLPDQMIRIRAEISGRVQGVGFRPLVYRYATQAGLSGFVNNTASGVVLEVQGNRNMLAQFFRQLEIEPPRISHVETMQLREIDLVLEQGFLITTSEATGETVPAFPPDLATCSECQKEIKQPTDRRFDYAFTNCIHCGPRFTIIHSLPYDRQRTAMRQFVMCPACQQEYGSVHDRRFHAQPNACSQCGPALQCVGANGQPLPGNPLETANTFLGQGKILALKGIGGYHLACDATNHTAIAALRKRKHRPDKALAVMFATIEAVRRVCVCSPQEEHLLRDCAAPIVLLRKVPGFDLPENLAPDTDELGVFLPYSPVHHLLAARQSPLVMTSGNLAEEPIAQDIAGLGKILGTIADAALDHDRPIVRRCDDSVMRVVGTTSTVLRRSRGYVPEPIELPFEGPRVFAAGADLKNTFCFTKGNLAFLSQHIGDLTDKYAYDFYREQIKDFSRLLNIQADVAVCDLHPDYRSSQYVRAGREKQIFEVQHHHSHIASAMVENGLNEKVIGVVMDGTGYGPDRTIWGGEILLANYHGFERLAHFQPIPMPGGDQAVRHPQRMALAYLYTYLKAEGLAAAHRHLTSIRKDDMAMLTTMLEQGVQTSLTSSAGRLFDAVAGLIGLHDPITYEAQAAMGLQFLADPDEEQAYTGTLEDHDGVLNISFERMFRQLLVDISSGAKREKMAAKFHNMLASVLCDACCRIKSDTEISSVVLSGGVFQNDLLSKKLRINLEQKGFTVYGNRLVPSNDGGIALGQAAIALASLQK
ncbi:carbamoyltransferase HypF [bacterium]|nr:carbamoyltransferase HypF [bacterium]